MLDASIDRRYDGAIRRFGRNVWRSEVIPKLLLNSKPFRCVTKGVVEWHLESVYRGQVRQNSTGRVLSAGHATLVASLRGYTTRP